MSNVNVTLTADVEPIRRFPCPLCAAQLDLRESRRQKPYCVCNTCGVQIFFRGKTGIARLRRMLEEHDRFVGILATIATPAIAAFNRLEQLRAQKSELEERRSFFSTDDDLEHTIAAVDIEIVRWQIVLEQLSSGSKS
jgi:DNA-directed RNA polymerase subunit RPC12/RpoP